MENFDDNMKTVLNELSKIAEKNGYDNYYFYNELITGDYLVKTFFEEYFRSKEGHACCCDKANYVVTAIKKMIQIKQNINLQQTYKEYKENGGNIGGIKQLDEICYWCPKSLKTTKEAIELFYKETINTWHKKVWSD